MSYFMDYRQEIEDAELDIYDKMSEELEEAIKHGDNADVLEKEYAMSNFVLLTERHHAMDEIEYLAHGDDAADYSEIIEECEDKLSHLCDEFDELEKDMEEAIMAGGVLGEKWEKRREKNEIAHYGIHGQRWGVRNYENYDGSLTEEGKARYGKESEGRMSRKEAKAEKARLKAEKETKKAELKSEVSALKSGSMDRALEAKNMSDDELWKATQRNLDEAKYIKSYEDKRAVMKRQIENKGPKLAKQGLAITSLILSTGGTISEMVAGRMPNSFTSSDGKTYSNQSKAVLSAVSQGARIASSVASATSAFIDTDKPRDYIRY